jgi:cyclophilin family peptidyl-prolyl cis-trans isomerase
MPRRSLFPLIVGLLLVGSTHLAVAQSQPASSVPAAGRTPGPPLATPLVEPPDTPAGDGTAVRLTTELGDIVIGLFNESAPVASENFLNLAQSGFYDGVTFHRLVPGFVIQGGDPSGDGTGGPGYTIEDEPVVGRYLRGTVAMARTSQPDSEGSQFFIVLDDAAESTLDQARTYAIFGRVVEGMEVVDAIAATPNSGEPDNRALDPIAITGTSVEQVTLPPEPTPTPEPSFVGDPELMALFPTQLAGQPVEIVSRTGTELVGQFGEDDPGLAALGSVLDAKGKTFGDFTLASTSVESDGGPGAITAVRIRELELGPLLGELAPLLTGYVNLETSPAEIAGKQVSVLTDGPDNGQARAYGYVSGDVLWVVFAEGPLLEEIVAALP